MFGGIFSWLIIGFVIYLMFSRRGGMMGCCGGYHHNSSRHANHPNGDSGHSKESQDEIIDLKKEDYRDNSGIGNAHRPSSHPTGGSNPQSEIPTGRWIGS